MRPTLMSSLEMSTARSTAASFGPFVGVAPFASRDTKQYQVFTTKNLTTAMGYNNLTVSVRLLLYITQTQ